MKIPKSFYQPTPWLFATISLPCQATNTGIGQCIGDIYNWSIAIVGIAAFIQVVRAGIEYFTAAGNASDAKDAKSKISDAILGIILLFSSYVILRTINPDLVGGGPGTGIFSPGPSDPAANQLLLISASPTKVKLGEVVTLSGTNFTSSSKVLIDDNPYDPTQYAFRDSTEIVVELKSTTDTPLLPGESISIAVKDGTRQTTAKTVEIIDEDEITLTNLSTNRGSPGDEVKLTGTNFTNQVKVNWNGVAIPSTFDGPSQITFKVPSNAKPAVYNITVTLDDTTAGPLWFAVVVADSGGPGPVVSDCLANLNDWAPPSTLVIPRGGGRVELPGGSSYWCQGMQVQFAIAGFDVESAFPVVISGGESPYIAVPKATVDGLSESGSTLYMVLFGGWQSEYSAFLVN